MTALVILLFQLIPAPEETPSLGIPWSARMASGIYEGVTDPAAADCELEIRGDGTWIINGPPACKYEVMRWFLRKEK